MNYKHSQYKLLKRFIRLASLSCLVLIGFQACQGNTSNQSDSNSETQSKTTPTEVSTTSDVTISAEEEPAKLGKITYSNDTFDFGKIKEGVIIEHDFTFVNEGVAPIIVRQVTASCGCTTPDYSRKPVAPGETGTIKVRFDSNGQVGKQHKVVTVVTNADTPVTLVHIRGEVSPK